MPTVREAISTAAINAGLAATLVCDEWTWHQPVLWLSRADGRGVFDYRLDCPAYDADGRPVGWPALMATARRCMDESVAFHEAEAAAEKAWLATDPTDTTRGAYYLWRYGETFAEALARCVDPGIEPLFLRPVNSTDPVELNPRAFPELFPAPAED